MAFAAPKQHFGGYAVQFFNPLAGISRTMKQKEMECSMDHDFSCGRNSIPILIPIPMPIPPISPTLDDQSRVRCRVGLNAMDLDSGFKGTGSDLPPGFFVPV